MTDWTARRPDDAPAEHENAVESEATEEAKIAALVEALSKESADYKDKLLRTLADMENLRRRTDREVADARAYGVSNFARDIVAVADNMARAMGRLCVTWEREPRNFPRGWAGSYSVLRYSTSAQRSSSDRLVPYSWPRLELPGTLVSSTNGASPSDW